MKDLINKYRYQRLVLDEPVVEEGIEDSLKKELFDLEQKGIIVTLISEWSPVMGYIVVASNPDEGRELQRRLFGLFKK